MQRDKENHYNKFFIKVEQLLLHFVFYFYLFWTMYVKQTPPNYLSMFLGRYLLGSVCQSNWKKTIFKVKNVGLHNFKKVLHIYV